MESDNDFVQNMSNTFVENREDRCTVLLVLDVSSSMTGEPIRQLNAGLQEFERQIKADALTSLRVDVGVLTFGANVDHVLLSAGADQHGTIVASKFVNAEKFRAPSLSANGSTPLYRALQLAIQSLEERKQEYKAAQIGYYRPWIVLITDGAPTDQSLKQTSLNAVQSAVKEQKLTLLAVGVQGANMTILHELAVGSLPPQMLQGLNFIELFKWLSSSLKSVSNAKPNTPLQLSGPDKWAIVS